MYRFAGPAEILSFRNAEYLNNREFHNSGALGRRFQLERLLLGASGSYRELPLRIFQDYGGWTVTNLKILFRLNGKVTVSIALNPSRWLIMEFCWCKINCGHLE